MSIVEIIEKLTNRTLELFDEFEALKKSMDEVSEWDSFEEVINNIGKINTFIMNLVLAVEISASEVIVEFTGIEGSTKRATAVAILDSLVTLPWYLEVVDGPMFELALSLVVDVLNKYMGHEWDLDLIKEVFSAGEDFIEYMANKLNK